MLSAKNFFYARTADGRVKKIKINFTEADKRLLNLIYKYIIQFMNMTARD